VTLDAVEEGRYIEDAGAGIDELEVDERIGHVVGGIRSCPGRT
jgi:hypothetical protein